MFNVIIALRLVEGSLQSENKNIMLIKYALLFEWLFVQHIW